MEDADGASSSRQPDDADDVTDPTDDTNGTPLPPPPAGADPSGEIPAPVDGDGDGDAIEDAELVDEPDDVEPEDVDAGEVGVDDVEPADVETDGPVEAPGADGDDGYPEDDDPDPDPALTVGEDDEAAVAAAGERPPRSLPKLPAAEPARSRAIAGIAAGGVAIVGLLAALVGGGGTGPTTAGPERTDAPIVETTEPATSDSPTTATPATDPGTTPAETATPTPAPTTAAPVTTAVPASDVPTTVAGVSPTTLLADPSATTTSVPGTVRVVRSVVPDVAAFTEPLDDVAQAQTIAELAVESRNDVASPGPVGSLCAIVRLEEQAQLEGRWERDGDEVDSTNLSTVGEPGFGDCLVEAEGTPLEEGTYQFIVADRDGNDSAAGTFVIGAVALEQTLVNNTGQVVCSLRLAPSDAGRYDAYDFGAGIQPGAGVIVPIADVDHDVRVDGCDADADPIEEFDFNPAAGVPQPLDPS